MSHEAWRHHLPTLPEGAAELVGDEAAAVWKALDVRHKRRVLGVVGLRVRTMPTRQDPGFIPEHVEITWPR